MEKNLRSSPSLNSSGSTSVLSKTKGKGLQIISLLILSVLLVILPLVSDNYWTNVATMCMFYIVLALGLNIIVGYAGLLDFGYSAFFAIGAYTTGILTTQYNVSFWLAMILGGVFAGIAGIIIGAPTLRLRSDYLAIVTLGFGEIIRILANNLEITGSATGIYGIKSPTIFGFTLYKLDHYYYAMLILAVFTVIVVSRLGNSRIGRAWKYIREDEDAAESMGINRVRVKLAAYVLGGVFGGLAGSLFAVKMTAVSPGSFTFMQSVLILLAVVIGGIGRIPAVILGAILVVVLPELLRDFAEWRYFLFGIALIIIMIFRPQGLLGKKPEKLESAEGER